MLLYYLNGCELGIAVLNSLYHLLTVSVFGARLGISIQKCCSTFISDLVMIYRLHLACCSSAL